MKTEPKKSIFGNAQKRMKAIFFVLLFAISFFYFINPGLFANARFRSYFIGISIGTLGALAYSYYVLRKVKAKKNEVE